MRISLKPLASGIAAILLLIALAGAMLSGCSRSKPVPASDEFFETWLRGHGESNIVADAHGVGIAGNPTRLRCSLYGSEKYTNSISAELEFRVRIPDGREIVEYVAGSGDSLKKAEDDAKVNFILTTFHVVYRSFLNPNDPHQTEESLTINGQPRTLVLGDTMARSQTTNGTPDMAPLRAQFRQVLTNLALSKETHWIKIVYANHHSKTMLCAVTLDNEDSPVLTEGVQNLPWPKQDEFYMLKQFIVVM